LELARPGIMARRRLEAGIRGLDPESVYQLAMMAFGDEARADHWRADAIRNRYDE